LNGGIVHPAQTVDIHPAASQPELPALAQTAHHPPVAPADPNPAPERQLPTLDDLALTGLDSDFSAFVTQGVDKTLQCLAMKKLFSDPRFHLMDGLDATPNPPGGERSVELKRRV
jgi:hypothetical protein